MDIIKNNKLQIKKTELPTRKQLERAISQKFYALYRQKIGCSPGKVTCTIYANYLIIVAEEAITPLELTIKKNGQVEILFEIRQSINRVLKTQLKKLVEEIAVVGIVDLICDLSFDSRRMMAIAILAELPQVRN